MAEACVSKTSRRQLVRSRNASVGAGNRFLNECNCDGFRIDTLKHVDHEFWQGFAPSLRKYAAGKLELPDPTRRISGIGISTSPLR